MNLQNLAKLMAFAVASVSLLLAGCGGGGDSATSAAPTPPVQGITKITITKTTKAAFGGTVFGSVGTYDQIEGIAYGQIDPNDPKSQVIADIGLAVKNPTTGMVEYAAPFYILKPSDLSKGNHKMFYEAPNRGGKQFGSLNMSGGGNDPGSAAANAKLQPTTVPQSPTGTTTYPAFLMNKGYTVVWSAWDALPVSNAIPATTGAALLMATLPLAKNPDGSSITGPSYVYNVGDNTTTTCFPVYYNPVSTDTTKATLTTRQSMTDTPVPVPAASWKWGSASDCKLQSGASISLVSSAAFTKSAIYELTYTAKDPYVAAVGLAAIRDFVSFLKNASADSLGTANPLAGDVKTVVGYGLSQPARLWNDYVWLGFNQDVGGKKVFDGIFSWIGGGNGLGINYRFAQSGRTERNRQNHIAQVEGVFPFSYTTTTDPLSGKTDGRNVRCTATDTCPKIMNIYSANEAWVKTGSLLTTDPSTGLDVGDPSNVRNYFIASTNHGNGVVPNNKTGTCSQFASTVDPNPVMRALFVSLDSWIAGTGTPPNSVNPSISAGTATFIPTDSPNTALGIGAVTSANVGYPTLPSTLSQFSGLVTVRNFWNFGSRYNQGILDTLPGIATGKFYKASVPKTDVDGNDLGGIILPELTAPIGSNSGWALRSSDFGGKADGNDGCEGTGQFVPFALDDASKLAGDPRASLVARYGNKAGWVTARANAATALLNQGLLLPLDAANYTTSGNQPLLVNTTTPNSGTTPGVKNPNYPSEYSYTW